MHPRRGPRQLIRHCPARLRRLVLPPSAGQPRLRRGRSLDAARASRRVARRQRPAAGTRWSPVGRLQVGERRHRGIAIDRLRWRRPGATPRTRRETGPAVAPWPDRGSCAAAGSGRRRVVARTRRRPPRMNPAATERRHDPPPRRHVRPGQDRGRPRIRRCLPRPRLPAQTDPALASRAALPAAGGFAAWTQVRGASLLDRDGGFEIALRDKAVCAGRFEPAGFDAFALSAPSQAVLDDVAARCDRLGVTHSGVREFPGLGAGIDIPDPDDAVVRLVWRDPTVPAFLGVEPDETGAMRSYFTPRPRPCAEDGYARAVAHADRPALLRVHELRVPLFHVVDLGQPDAHAVLPPAELPRGARNG